VSGTGATHVRFKAQSVGATQSSAELHVARQAPLLSHLYGAQSCFVPSAPVVV
jgi:hypothetical protein